MKIHTFFRINFFVISLLLTRLGLSMNGSNAPQDPVSNIRYTDAFDQTAVYSKFKKYLITVGCASNVFESPQDAKPMASLDNQDSKEDRPINDDVPLLVAGIKQDSPTLIDQLIQAEYEEACLKKLRSARNWAITEPARESLTLLGLLIGAATSTTALLGTDSFGGSFSVSAVMFNAVFLLRDSIRSVYNYAYPPIHALNRLEEKFARNKCYIPKVFWGKIIEEFMKARQNQFAQLKAMDFLEFALELTTYKPKPMLMLNQTKQDQICSNLHDRIDSFFKDYEFGAAKDKSITNFCWCIKINTDKFIKALATKKSQAPRYIYLFGPGGIGKTYFIQKLCSWIEELIPGSVRFENMTITTPTELEGDTERPSAILRVLRNQLMSNKNASVVFMDEATWLNDNGMINSAKRVFNGDQSRISTSFFGAGIEGAGINLAIPPMFIFCAGNKKIDDLALASRFDSPTYPLPKQSALAAHAFNIARQSSSLQKAGIRADIKVQEKLKLWIKNAQIDNFRRAASEVELYLLQDQTELDVTKDDSKDSKK